MDLWNIKNQATGCKPQLVLDFSHHQFYWPLFNTQCSIHVLLTNTDTHQPNSCPSVPQKNRGGGSNSNGSRATTFVRSSVRQVQKGGSNFWWDPRFLIPYTYVTWRIHWLLLLCSEGRNWPSDGFGAWSKRFQCDGWLKKSVTSTRFSSCGFVKPAIISLFSSCTSMSWYYKSWYWPWRFDWLVTHTSWVHKGAGCRQKPCRGFVHWFTIGYHRLDACPILARRSHCGLLVATTRKRTHMVPLWRFFESRCPSC